MGTVKIGSLVISKRIRKHRAMLQRTLKWMSEEFDSYIDKHKAVPWLYNERAILGFFVSGLARNSDAVMLQEFSCQKGKGRQKRKSGRADLFFSLDGVNYLLESKCGYSAVDTRSEMDEAKKWAEEVLEQANQYAEEAEVKKGNIFSMCFNVVYCSEKKIKDYSKKINDWHIKGSELAGLDYYTLIEIANRKRKKVYSYDGYRYPAIAVYGLFNHG